MGRGQTDTKGIEDVQVLGEWNFTLQGDTPLHWLRCGQLDRYLMRFTVHSACPSTCGIVFHAEADGPGTDGTSFWIERRPARTAGGGGTKRYVLSGEGLESKPIVTRTYSDDGGETSEKVELLMQGSTGAIFVNDRKVQIRFRTKIGKGSLCFYNTTQNEDRDDVHFSGVAITALRRGPLEVDGALATRERKFLGQQEADRKKNAEAANTTSQAMMARTKGSVGFSGASTSVPKDTWLDDSTQRSGFNQRSASSPNMRATMPAQSWAGAQGSPDGKSMQSAKGGMRQSASGSMLRRTAGATMTGGKGAGRAKGVWLPLAMNPHHSEQKLLKDTYKKDFERNACTDFVPLAVL